MEHFTLKQKQCVCFAHKKSCSAHLNPASVVYNNCLYYKKNSTNIHKVTVLLSKKY